LAQFAIRRQRHSSGAATFQPQQDRWIRHAGRMEGTRPAGQRREGGEKIFQKPR
jgi:hypothetical protein